MDRIENVKISELETPRFVRPKEVTFEQNGVSRRWEMVNIHNAVFGKAFSNFEITHVNAERIFMIFYEAARAKAPSP